MLPTITELELNIEELTENLPTIGKSFLYDFDKGDFVLMNGKLIEVKKVESLKVWITKAIKTEKYKFRIYHDTEYGTTIYDLIGSNYPRSFIEAEIKREVTDSLTTHLYIQNIVDWQFVRDGSWIKVKFKVVTVDGAFDQEVTL